MEPRGMGRGPGFSLPDPRNQAVADRTEIGPVARQMRGKMSLLVEEPREDRRAEERARHQRPQ